ncbi:hypothetical protein EDC96DRAFT_503461 [Choanephora cucurbitarum]|nr:hypothetical protein EDC96DRAFT_503461 [Choanephora cucurbitarum]
MTDLQSVITKYHTNPELLKLILASKVEEDKRRTEEAKLKAKELDLYLKNQEILIKGKAQESHLRRSSNNNSSQNQYNNNSSNNYDNNNSNSNNIINYSHLPNSPPLPDNNTNTMTTTSTLPTSSNNNSNDNSNHLHRRIAPYTIPRPIVMSPRRNSSSLLSINQLSIHGQNNNHLMSTSAPNPSSQQLFPLPSFSNSSHPSALSNNAMMPTKMSRRRKSMQAITKIVETTDFPYDDHYFWKNNGNTVQKKTGCKSVYYKCANSCKGCPVNKTVIEQPDGSYLIKYRGDHIPECTKVEHIRDL